MHDPNSPKVYVVSVLNVVFFGSDPIALPLLDWLWNAPDGQARLIAVYTQPDRPVGRGQKLQANGIKQWALSHGLPVYQPEKMTEEAREEFAGLGADLTLVMAYGNILKQDFIDTPRLGTLNFHTSLLPKYRGASPIQTAVAMGEKETGVSLMRIVRELDAGPVADVEKVNISSHDTALEVEAKLSAASVPLLSRNWVALAAGTLEFQEQNHAEATFCRRLMKTDGSIDLREPARSLAARINGLFPWPAAILPIKGQPVKIGLAEVEAGNGTAGEVLGNDDRGLLVVTGEGILRLLKMQRPGGKMLAAGDFLRGFPIEAGMLIESSTMETLVSDTPFRR